MFTNRTGLVLITALVSSAATWLIVGDEQMSASLAHDRIRMVAQALQQYANENKNRLPPTLGYLLTINDVKASTFVPDLDRFPADFDRLSEDEQMLWVEEQTDLLYLQSWQYADPRRRDENAGHFRSGKPKLMSRELPLVCLIDGEMCVVGYGDASLRYFKASEDSSPRSDPQR
jgi:hypothetical protein